MARSKEAETHFIISKADPTCLCGAPLLHRKVTVVEEMLDKAKGYKERGEEMPLSVRLGPRWHRTCGTCWQLLNAALDYERKVREWREDFEEIAKEGEEAAEEPTVRDEITAEEILSFAQYAFQHGASVEFINSEVQTARARRTQ